MPVNSRCITKNVKSVGHKLETCFQQMKSFNDAPQVHFDNQISSCHSKERKGPTYKVLQIKPRLMLRSIRRHLDFTKFRSMGARIILQGQK